MANKDILQDIFDEMTVLIKPQAIVSHKFKTNNDNNHVTNINEDMFMVHQLIDIDNMMDVPTFEVEAIFGTYKQYRFFPGTRSLFLFNNILDRLSHLNYMDMRDTVTIDNKTNIRKIVDYKTKSVRYETKKLMKVLENRKYGIKIKQSLEEFTTQEHFNESENNIIRERTRKSFTDKNQQGIFYGMRVDITAILERTNLPNSKVRNINKYEVELECLENVTVKHFLAGIKQLFMLFQDAHHWSQIMDQIEYSNAFKLHNKLLNNKNNNNDTLYNNYRAKPVNITLKEMIKYNFTPRVTIKLDGFRITVIVNKTGVYAFNPLFYVIKIGNGNMFLQNTVIDCEMLCEVDEKGVAKTIFYGFDLLFKDNTDLRSITFAERYDKLLADEPNIQLTLFSHIEYHTKSYFQGNFYNQINEALPIFDSMPTGSVDGLILQSAGLYDDANTYKWKPKSELTIDFLVKKVVNDDKTNIDYKIYNKTDTGLELFTGNKTMPVSSNLLLVSDEPDIFDDQNIDNKIVECHYNDEHKQFTPIRYRDDRNNPNNLTTAINVWIDINNPLERDTLLGKDLKLMRKFHNIKKGALLMKEFNSGDVIIDIGSGRGGDLFKWHKRKFSKVIAVDPNSENLEEFKTRLSKMNIDTKIALLNTGAENTDAILKEVGTSHVNGIVLFFSLTFFMKKDIYSKLIDTLKILPPHSKILGIVMDSDKIKKLLEDTEKFDCNSFKIHKSTEFSVPIATKLSTEHYTNEILVDITSDDSMIKNLTEWLFDFNTFKKSLSIHHYKLLYTYFLDSGVEYNKLPDDGKVFSALNRVFCFEKIEQKNIDIPIAKKRIKLPIGINNFIKLPTNKYFKNGHIVGTKIDEHNIIHAVVYCCSGKYRSSSQKERDTYIAEIRKVLYKSLNIEQFKHINGGNLAETLLKKYEYPLDIAFNVFKAAFNDQDTNKNYVLLCEYPDGKFKESIDTYNKLKPTYDKLKNKNYKCILVKRNNKHIIPTTLNAELCLDLLMQMLDINIVILMGPDLKPLDYNIDYTYGAWLYLYTEDNITYYSIIDLVANTQQTMFKNNVLT